jgi:hypothetical protein
VDTINPKEHILCQRTVSLGKLQQKKEQTYLDIK